MSHAQTTPEAPKSPEAPESPATWRAEKHNDTWSHTFHKPYQTELEVGLKLAAQGPAATWTFTTTQQGRPDTNLMRLNLGRDKEGVGLNAQTFTWQEGKWERQTTTRVNFWPESRIKADVANLEADGISPRTWHDQTMPLRVQVGQQGVHVWLQGKIVAQWTTPVDAPSLTLTFVGAKDDTIVNVAQTPAVGGWRYHVVDLSTLVNEQAASPVQVDSAIPHRLAGQGQGRLNLKNAQWIDSVRNPASYYERYDAGVYFLGDDRQPMVQIPRGDYVAAHVLAAATTDEDFTNTLTLRMGRYNTSIRGQVLRYDFTASIPRVAQPDRDLQWVRVELPRAFAQDLQDDVMDVELTKEVRLVRRTPDPNRFRWRPVGLPSGVRIAAITFERSPLQMSVTSDESGHLFVEPQKPLFKATLRNISTEPQRYTLIATALHDGKQVQTRVAGQVDPGAQAAVPLTLNRVTQRGHHEVRFELRDAGDRLLLERRTTFAVLPDVQRPHHATSHLGVWDFCGNHLTPNDPDQTGPMYQKVGLRFGMFNYTPEKRAQYGVTRGNEFAIRTSTKIEEPLARYHTLKEQHPDMLPSMLLFHEDSISGPHVTRVPDLFHDREPYKLNEQEQERFDMMFKLAAESARQMRALDPNVRISIGNGPVPLREEFYRQGFPRELFDAAGNEAGVFGRLPERQPPDIVANNASIWMDRQLLDYYGYGEKPIVQCFEIIYPGTNPGNLSMETQAAYYIRHVLHSMAWGMPEIRPGSLTDMANSYYFSNWGSSGIFHKWPEINPKPSAIAFATFTWVFDGATFDRKLDLGSDSLYGLSFHRPDGQRIIALWTVRGQRPVTLTLTNKAKATLIDSQGSESAVKVRRGQATVTLSPTPVYLVLDGDVTDAQPGEPTYDAKPRGQATTVATLDALDEWAVVKGRNTALEVYNPMEPRRKGNFKFEQVAEFEGRRNVIRVTPQAILHGKATMPMYAELTPQSPITLPGKPSELGLWVNGNSGWGRIIFTLKDAKGQTWTSIGAPGREGNPWLADWLPKDVLEGYDPSKSADWNTNDAFGLSAINFDGWRYLGIPLPGQYRGGDYHWPANSQWRYDGDGIVAYPLTLQAIVVQLPEKVLHVADYNPPRRQAIYLSNLVSVEADMDDAYLKKTIEEYDPRVQTSGF